MLSLAVHCMARSTRIRCLLVLALAMLLLAPAISAAGVLVFAAASLKPALDAIIATPEAQAIGPIRASYAASSQLARQIEHGAPAAIFISADQKWMDHVERAGLVVAGTRVNLLGNALVLSHRQTVRSTSRSPRVSTFPVRSAPVAGLQSASLTACRQASTQGVP